MGPLTDYVPAAGLRWLAVARLSELAHTADVRASIDRLFPRERVDAFRRLSGVDLYEVPAALAAGYDLATLYLAETPSEVRDIEDLFVARLVGGSTRARSAHPDVHRISGALASSPEALVTVKRRFVGVAVGDPTLARVVELFALGRLRSPAALHGAALSTLPGDLASAPLQFYAPGPFPEDWAPGARGLLGAASAVGVAAWPSGPNTLGGRIVVSGQWVDGDAARLGSAWNDLAESSLGRLLGLDQPVSPPKLQAAPGSISLEVQLALGPLASGLRAAVAADVWEILADSPPPPAPPNGGPSPSPAP